LTNQKKEKMNIFTLLLTIAPLCEAPTDSIPCDNQITAEVTEPVTMPAEDLSADTLQLDARLDWSEERALGLAIDNISFFKDNEFDSQQTRGYSLPGLWVAPRLTYQPLKNVRFEAGFHALIFNGANKYPCYAYHDIGMWKGNQYQSGAHLLPFFRAQAQLGRVSFILGNIYNNNGHGLMEALWNPELALTQDPEAGMQILIDQPHWKFDIWLNWQSYIFETDTHKEAFTVGFNIKALLNDSQQRLHFYIPFNALAMHRGGEQNITNKGVQTIVNGSIGLGLDWKADYRLLRSLNAEAALLGCWQQSGHLWPFNHSLGGALQLSAQLAGGFRVFGGFFYAKDFVSLYGAPFYSTLSQKEDDARFASTLTPHIGGEWFYSFAKDFQLGAKVNVYPVRTGALTHADGKIDGAASTTNFSFGFYMRYTPRFIF